MNKKETRLETLFGQCVAGSVGLLIVLACIGGVIGIVKWIARELW